ncbi:dephospho-CoA kinase [Pelagibacteraceae bacterium]|nr:dephospho-CoA kinase [Pelagibacteraceae bacterium]
MKIGITGSLASGKSSVAKILSKNKNLLFSADQVVKNLYFNNKFINKIKKKFNIKNKNIKNEIKSKLIKKEISLKELGSTIHPYVRSKMKEFYRKNKKKKIIFFEIPLLIESKLMGFFDYIILVVAPKKERLKRYLKNGGEKNMFLLLDKNQIPAKKKVKFCDYLIVNNKSKNVLKKNVNGIIKNV